MATNFPDTSINNPNTGVGWANGDAFDDTAESGLIYYWYDPVWKTEFTPTAASDARYVEVAGDTMTGDLTVPSLESTGDVQMASQNGGPLAGFRNHIINGDLRIWQRGDNFYNQKNADGQYTTDRWTIFCADDNNGGGFHVVKDSDAPNGFTYSTRIVNASGVDAPGYGAASFIQRVENLKKYSGGKFTLSCLVKSGSADTTYFRLYSRANYGTGGSPEAPYTQLSETFSNLSGDFDNTGWTRISWTFDIPTLTGTFGTDNNSYLEVGFSGIGLARSQFLFVTGVQLEHGPVATPFEHRPIGTELALCQRYYWQYITYYDTAVAQIAGSSGAGSVIFSNPVTFRVRPSVTVDNSNGESRYISSSTDGTPTSITYIAGVDENFGSLYCTFSPGFGGSFTSGYVRKQVFKFDAEL